MDREEGPFTVYEQRSLLAEIAALKARVENLISGPPAQMSWAKGLIPINSAGMREVIDAYDSMVKRAEGAEKALEEIKKHSKEWAKGQNTLVRTGLLIIDGIVDKALKK